MVGVSRAGHFHWTDTVRPRSFARRGSCRGRLVSTVVATSCVVVQSSCGSASDGCGWPETVSSLSSASSRARFKTEWLGSTTKEDSTSAVVVSSCCSVPTLDCVSTFLGDCCCCRLRFLRLFCNHPDNLGGRRCPHAPHRRLLGSLSSVHTSHFHRAMVVLVAFSPFVLCRFGGERRQNPIPNGAYVLKTNSHVS